MSEMAGPKPRQPARRSPPGIDAGQIAALAANSERYHSAAGKWLIPTRRRCPAVTFNQEMKL